MKISSLKLVILLLPLGFGQFKIYSHAQVVDLRTITSVTDELFDDYYSDFGRSITLLGDLDGDGAVDLGVGAPYDKTGGLTRGAVWVLFMQSTGGVKAQQKINNLEGGFNGELDELDWFGSSITSLGDLDGNGVADLAVGAPGDGEIGRGAVWVLFLQSDGRVKRHQKISLTEGGFTGMLGDEDSFGSSIISLGDLDGDGVTDLAVGAPGDYGGGIDRGAVWVLFLHSDGRVKRHQKISQTQGSFTDVIDEYDRFGLSITSPGDLNGDGVTDLVVGAEENYDGGGSGGAVWVLFLHSDGHVKGHQKISQTAGGFTGALVNYDRFGSSITSPGDLNGDGVVDLVVGAQQDGDGGNDRGAIWVLFLQSDGRVKGHQKISQTEGGFTGVLADYDRFGSSITTLGDLDGDDIEELAVGASNSVWVLFMQPDGRVKGHNKNRHWENGFSNTLADYDGFGRSVTSLGDLDGDGVSDLLVEALSGDWMLFMQPDGRVKGHQKIGQSEDGSTDELSDYLRNVSSITSLGDLDGDGEADLALVKSDTLWVLFMQLNGQVKGYRKISRKEGGFEGTPGEDDRFGSSMTSPGDLDGDGFVDLAVGAPGNDAVWILFLQSDGQVKGRQKIAHLEGGFTGRLDRDSFGQSVTSFGDLDRDGIADLAVGAPGDGEIGKGAVWVLFLQSDGRVKGYQKINESEGGFTGLLDWDDYFGLSITSPGDLDGDGVADLVVGAPTPGGGIDKTGIVWILYMQSDGQVKVHQKISQSEAGFTGKLDDGDGFGWSVASLGDLDGNGAADLVVGAPGDDTGGPDRGAVWMLFLNGGPTFGSTINLEKSVTVGENVLLGSAIFDKQGIENARVHFKRGGDSSRLFLANLLVPSSDGMYEGIIPASIVTDRGVEFYFTAEDVFGLLSRQPKSGVFELRVDVPDIRLSDPFAIDSYRLFSVPLDVTSKSPEAILRDDLGPYDPTIWRLFEPLPGLTPDVFPEYPDVSEMVPGKAFWLITESTNTTISTGPGQSNFSAVPFAIPLKPSWNYIGNPYTFSVPLSNLTLQSGDSLDIRTYGDSGWRSLTESEFIEPFEGYIVANTRETVDTLFIKAEAPDESASASKREVQDEAVWAIRLSARAGTVSDEETVATVYEVSTAGLDRLDRPASPQPMGDYVSVYFPHPDWQQHFKRYSVDARPLHEDGSVWDFEVTTNVRDAVTLTFEEIDTVPPEFEVWLLDQAVNLSQNLREINTYTVAGPLESHPKQLKLVVGRTDFAEAQGGSAAELPLEYSLSQNFPNPFSVATTIPYALPGPERVTLIVYSILGERVATILRGEEKEAGYHAAIWDGRNDARQPVASGLYFLELRAGSSTETRKTMVVR